MLEPLQLCLHVSFLRGLVGFAVLLYKLPLRVHSEDPSLRYANILISKCILGTCTHTLLFQENKTSYKTVVTSFPLLA